MFWHICHSHEVNVDNKMFELGTFVIILHSINVFKVPTYMDILSMLFCILLMFF